MQSTISLKRLANSLRLCKKADSAWRLIKHELSQNGNKVFTSSRSREVLCIEYNVGHITDSCWFEYSLGVRDVSFSTFDSDETYFGVNGVKRGLAIYLAKHAQSAPLQPTQPKQLPLL